MRRLHSALLAVPIVMLGMPAPLTGPSSAASREQAATIILAVVAVAGRPLLAAFGISMPALQAAGGLVILLMGLEMLHGAPTKVQHDEDGAQSPADRVLVPLAMPLLAGPGAITTVLTLSSRMDTWRGTAMLLMAVAIVGATIGVILLSAARVGRAIGSRSQRILLRFMGLILAAVGAEVLLAGLYTFVPGAA